MKLKKAIVFTLLLMLTLNFNVNKSVEVAGDLDEHIIDIFAIV
ncbi:hypothetical protein AB9Q04_01100 [Anaerococcus sp. ENR1011]|uniref:Uncharacterized protein n=1 Tax=Anaerococcus groningensis TaxID=3115616 RepID=A0ABW9MYP1_9FIRM